MPKRASIPTENEDAAGPGDEARPVASHQDFDGYIADMILELQQLAARTGNHELSVKLLAAYQVARPRS